MELKAVLLRSQSPAVVDVTFGEDYAELVCTQREVPRVAGIRSESVIAFACPNGTQRLTFVEVMSIDIVRPVNYVDIYGEGRRKIVSLLPASSDDLYLLIDLIASFRRSIAGTGTLPELKIEALRRTDMSKAMGL
ncbi:MAG: hypothetical protein MJE77_24940 [Proteobacteria bacterium]|nr:hypothetical protein [Pseudomonadota bacterium]